MDFRLIFVKYKTINTYNYNYIINEYNVNITIRYSNLIMDWYVNNINIINYIEINK